MIAHELGLDDDIVRTWPPSKLKGWWSYFSAKSDIESEAMERAQRLARVKSMGTG